MSNEKEVRNIRRGQVFYLSKEKDGRTVSEPYIVLSNNRCNESSAFIHAAPVRQGEADPDRYYHCGFSGTCHKSMFVDVSRTTLISRDKFNDQTYSAAQSFYTVNNTDLLNSIEEALCQQLGITKNYVVYSETQATQTQRNQEPIQVTINMNITGLDTNATPVTVTAEPVITAVQKKEPDVFVEPEQVRKSVEKVYQTPVLEVTSPTQSNDPSSTRVHSKYEGYHRTVLSKSEQIRLIDTILSEAKPFGGKLSSNQIATKLGLSYTTVYRYTRELVKNGGTIKLGRTKRENTKKVKHSALGFAHRRCEHILVKPDYKGISTTTLEKAVELFNNGGAQAVVKCLPNTFPNEHSVRNFIFRNCAKVEVDKADK